MSPVFNTRQANLMVRFDLEIQYLSITRLLFAGRYQALLRCSRNTKHLLWLGRDPSVVLQSPLQGRGRVTYQPPPVSLIPGTSALDFQTFITQDTAENLSAYKQKTNVERRFSHTSTYNFQQRVFVVTRNDSCCCGAPEHRGISPFSGTTTRSPTS
jgi:hypothetical protein